MELDVTVTVNSLDPTIFKIPANDNYEIDHDELIKQMIDHFYNLSSGDNISINVGYPKDSS
jgi:hypothetical protein